MTTPELEAAGFREDCEDCRAAVRRDLEACSEHYVPTHERIDPRECRCGGRKDPADDLCGRCRAAGVA